GDDVILYVCKTESFDAGSLSCPGGLYCNSAATATDPSCGLTAEAGTNQWCAYLVDEFGLEALSHECGSYTAISFVDVDGDGYDDILNDTCPPGTGNCLVSPDCKNPYQDDADGDTVGDLCDLCPATGPGESCPGRDAQEINTSEETTVSTPQGSLTIPAGSLPPNSTIVVEDTGTWQGGFITWLGGFMMMPMTTAHWFGPTGTTFDPPAELCFYNLSNMGFLPCSAGTWDALPPYGVGPWAIARDADNDGDYTEDGSFMNSTRCTDVDAGHIDLCAAIDSFSTYTVVSLGCELGRGEQLTIAYPGCGQVPAEVGYYNGIFKFLRNPCTPPDIVLMQAEPGYELAGVPCASATTFLTYPTPVYNPYMGGQVFDIACIRDISTQALLEVQAIAFSPDPPPAFPEVTITFDVVGTGDFCAQCGNDVVEAGEECDGGDCCDLDCTFSSDESQCRAAAGLCDVGEYCTGQSAYCPNDYFKSDETQCRDANGACDVGEYCTGQSPSCPPDAFKSAGTQCRASGGVCDVTEVCSGTDAYCPADAVASSDTTCQILIEYGCPWGTEDGDDVGRNNKRQYCDGDSKQCVGVIVDSWSVYQDCGTCTYCGDGNGGGDDASFAGAITPPPLTCVGSPTTQLCDSDYECGLQAGEGFYVPGSTESQANQYNTQGYCDGDGTCNVAANGQLCSGIETNWCRPGIASCNNYCTVPPGPDDDQDGYLDICDADCCDNCDFDGDGWADQCDTDDDNDGILDIYDCHTKNTAVRQCGDLPGETICSEDPIYETSSGYCMGCESQCQVFGEEDYGPFYCDMYLNWQIGIGAGATCDDGLFCKVNDVCDGAGTCGGTPRDCSENNLPEIGTCNNIPDNYQFTWDSAPGFTSVCNEDENFCTEGSYSFTHSCDVSSCGAQCDIESQWQDYCEGDSRIFGGTCNLENCQWSNTGVDDCNEQDRWYDTGNTRIVPIEGQPCDEKEQKEQEYRDYTCGGEEIICVYTPGQTQWVDTGVIIDNDEDNDFACDDIDLCPGTVADTYENFVAANNAIFDGEQWVYNAGTSSSMNLVSAPFTMVDTKGCACGDNNVPSIMYCHPGNAIAKHGCPSVANNAPKGLLQVWVDQTGWALECIDPVTGLVIEGEAKSLVEDTDNAGVIDIFDVDNDNDGFSDGDEEENLGRLKDDQTEDGKPDWWCDKHPTKC
ncbi:MAG: hypothetical protein ACYTAF_08110, partial [Planctomycetota bacterium]